MEGSSSVIVGTGSDEREQLLVTARNILVQYLPKKSKTTRWLERCLTAQSVGHLALLVTGFTVSFYLGVRLLQSFPVFVTVNLIVLAGCAPVALTRAMKRLQQVSTKQISSTENVKPASVDSGEVTLERETVGVERSERKVCSERTLSSVTDSRKPSDSLHHVADLAATVWVDGVLLMRSFGCTGETDDWRVWVVSGGLLAGAVIVYIILPMTLITYTAGLTVVLRPWWIQHKLSDRVKPYLLQMHYLHGQRMAAQAGVSSEEDDLVFAVDTQDMAASVQFEEDLVRELQQAIEREQSDEEACEPELLQDSLLGLNPPREVEKSDVDDPWDFNQSLDGDAEFEAGLAFPSLLPDGRLRSPMPSSAASSQPVLLAETAEVEEPAQSFASTSADPSMSSLQSTCGLHRRDAAVAHEPDYTDSPSVADGPEATASLLQTLPSEQTSKSVADTVPGEEAFVDLTRHLADAAKDLPAASAPSSLTPGEPDDFEIISAEEAKEIANDGLSPPPQQTTLEVLAAAPGAYLKSWLGQGD